MNFLDLFNSIKIPKNQHYSSQEYMTHNCGISHCQNRATHKIEEVIAGDDPSYYCRETLKNYLCCYHFKATIGDRALCTPDDPVFDRCKKTVFKNFNILRNKIEELPAICVLSKKLRRNHGTKSAE